ncbi:DegT/DnrJ/EryC1/StrS family aminotransferase [Acetobacteroides hydrogenigenes]|uniref:dTDP-4-amino-4,6-dideoxygalactose transaminase n=1 Tax=Acetobacteroides hydrogenigenes TaxID=979970 RepID=A0A4R2E8V7_9BACT|nr:DegT/DnrJ/EryC1/StrS family aminotransferase [Acetobacteroides hydrogenigenes]TCN62214.1 dTDP-4-amino-4,6-dideoxygalactose transaminase [Acetobacteroides hydrogenigenes]
MKIPFSLPVIDDDVVKEMQDTLTNTGWLTTGPKTRTLEEEIRKFCNASEVLCVNSWTSGAMLMLRWFGIGYGDEVIIPAYTYSATALCALNMGATPVMVDVKDDFTIDESKLKSAITSKTKAILPVDIGGWPCDYNAIKRVLEDKEVKSLFTPSNPTQEKLDRILVISDAAHSLGATFDGIESGLLSDVTVFSLHSVKNITTGEGGAIVLNLPEQFDQAKELTYLRALALNGQNKSAFEKNQPGAWRYDIIDQGLKVNMPDLCASVGLSQMRRYRSTLLPERKEIFSYYVEKLSQYDWAIIPPHKDNLRESSYHLFMLRVKDFSEEQRDRMIQIISESGVGVNVHYIPMAMLTLFKSRGYNISDYPQTYELYKNEISLPIYNGLTKDQLDLVISTVVDAYNKVIE